MAVDCTNHLLFADNDIIEQALKLPGEPPDHRHRRLLRPRHHRPCRRTPEPRDERPAFH
jgi:hypothetical protein